MDRQTRAEWLRLLTGELAGPAAREVRERIRRRPELEAAFRELETTWRSLELPPPVSAPPGFATRVGAAARSRAQRGLAPIWWRRTVAGRAATVAILVAGIVLGSLLATPGQSEEWGDYLTDEPSWAESYLTDIESATVVVLPEDQP